MTKRFQKNLLVVGSHSNNVSETVNAPGKIKTADESHEDLRNDCPVPSFAPKVDWNQNWYHNHANYPEKLKVPENNKFSYLVIGSNYIYVFMNNNLFRNSYDDSRTWVSSKILSSYEINHYKNLIIVNILIISTFR